MSRPIQINGTNQLDVPVVLIVDDDAELREILIYSLRRDHYRIEEAPNGVVALSICERLRPDIALLDIMMPIMDGVETCARIRSLPGGEHIPVLMITALDAPTAI